MIKHTQVIRRLLPTNCFSVFDNFVDMALKELGGDTFFTEGGRSRMTPFCTQCNSTKNKEEFVELLSDT